MLKIQKINHRARTDGLHKTKRARVERKRFRRKLVDIDKDEGSTFVIMTSIINSKRTREAELCFGQGCFPLNLLNFCLANFELELKFVDERIVDLTGD
jgi:hypothetical protein